MATRVRDQVVTRFTLIVLLSLMLLGMASTAALPRAEAANQPNNIVLEWNQHALDAFSNPATAPTPGAGMPPQVSILHIAMVQGAIYDAVMMIERTHQPYNAGLPAAPRTASKTAAVATAAHRVIVGVQVTPALSPAIIARVNARLADSIAAATSADGTAAVQAGIAAGEAAAQAMLEVRANDGRFVPTPVEAGDQPGQWRPTPPTNGPDPFAWVGNVEPFMLTAPSQFRSKGPLAVTSRQYARDYEEVKLLGGPTATSPRTPEQEAVALFFIVNPTELYNRAFRAHALKTGLTLGEQARFFAAVNFAGADALINCFNDKLHYRFWRPITAIRLGDDDGNRWTAGDPEWVPLVGTPAYSEHPSGYNCVTAAMMYTARDFFNEPRMRRGNVDFELVRIAPGAPDVTRVYQRFTDVIPDTIDARIYQGIHFRTAEDQGAQIGRDVSRWLGKHYFKGTR